MALGQIGGEAIQSITPLRTLLNDPDDNVRLHVAYALFRIDPQRKEGVPVLRQLLRGSPRYRGPAAVRLGQMGAQAKEAVGDLIQFLESPDPTTRSCVAGALGKIGPEARDAVPALVRLLRDTDPHVRAIAAQALGGIGPQARSAVPGLEKLQQDPDAHIRAIATAALKRIGKR
jgi:HEAT repeat protein